MSAVVRNAICGASGVTTNGTSWSSCGRGDPLILIHGVGMNQSVWSPQIEALKEEFQVIAYDMIGHGASRYLQETKDIADYAQQLTELMHELDIQRAHIVGHSMGALIALEMAVARATLCKSVIALNGVYCRTGEQRASVQARAREFYLKGKPDSVQETIYRWFGNPILEKDSDAAQKCTQLLQHVPFDGYAKAYAIFSDSDERHLGRLESIRVPVLLATGELDHNSSPAMAHAMHEAIAGSDVQILANQRHMMSLVAVDQVNTMIRNFAKKHSQEKSTNE